MEALRGKNKIIDAATRRQFDAQERSSKVFLDFMALFPPAY